MAPLLLQTIAKNFKEGEKTVLVEPFAGGAGASLALLSAGVVDNIIINDLDRAIHAFWKTALDETDYLIRKVQRTQVTINEWQRQRKVYLNPTSSQRQLGFAVLYLNRTNRSGLIGGRPIGGLKQNGPWKIGARFTKSTITSRLRNIKELRDRISVLNYDGIALLKRLEQQRTASRFLVFLDPPYYEQGDSLYLNHYREKNHRALANYLAESDLKWIMTYDDTKFIRQLYPAYYKSRLSISHSVQRHKQGNEIVLFGKHTKRVIP